MKGAIKERKGEEKGEKEEEERGKTRYDQLSIFQVLKKLLIFTKKEGEEKGEEIFTNSTQNKRLTFLLQIVTSKTSSRFYG